MGATIAAPVYIGVALAAAFVLRPRMVDNPAIIRAGLFWAAVTPFLYFIYPMLGSLAVAGLLLALLTPKGLENRAAYYLIALFAAPSGMKAEVPFPGINHLIVVDFSLIAGLILLAPAIFLIGRSNAARYAPAAGIMLLLFTALISIQEFRTENITNGLRGAVYQTALYALPYMALIRLASRLDRFERIFSALLALAVVYACLSFVSQATDWNFYTLLTERHGIPTMADFRQGILRVSVTTVPVLAGFIATLGFLTTEYFRAQRKCGALIAWLYRGMFITAAIFTFSRGAWIAMMIGVLTYYFFTKAPRSLRPPVIFLVAAFMAPMAATFIMQADFDRIDQYGTFEYRLELLRTSIDYIGRYPLFGDPDYLASGAFDHLYQGQGIIDVVNYYLQIALEHGLIALALFVGAFASVILGLLRLGRLVRARDDVRLEQQRATFLGALAAYLILIGTVSNVTLIPHMGVALLALAAAFVAAARGEFAAGEKAARETGAESASPDAIEGDLFDERA